VLVLRNEDLDPRRSRPEHVQAMIEDLQWLGINWDEGPDCGGPYPPYTQSERRKYYLSAWKELVRSGWIYPCTCSRKDVMGSAQAPHEAADEPIYPGKCRGNPATAEAPAGVNWRFRVPEGRVLRFVDQHLGAQEYTAGQDFGDFLVWRKDDVPAYQLAVVVDDAAMKITEVVRGADLLRSTARQMLLQEALGAPTPAYFHCDLVMDKDGTRMAKRQGGLTLRGLREAGVRPEQVRAGF
jgi:glutamyl/glutaminyl-tRNA synthetase